MSTTLTDTSTIPVPDDAAKPKSRMAATWHMKPREQWGFHEKMLHDLYILQDPHGSARPPVFPKDAPVPVFSILSQHAWVLPRTIPPLIINIVFTLITGYSVPKYIAGPLYLAWFLGFGVSLFGHLQRMTKAYGFFDGTKSRDGIPDVDIVNVANELLGVISLRAIFATIFVYPSDQSALLDWKSIALLPFNLFMYSVILDFYFYWYHRLMHEVDWLWQFHQKHHRTKHPNAALGAFADHEQELFDMLVIPVLTYLTWRVDFPTWWLATSYSLYIEAAGHSGMRAWFTNPTSWPLTLFGTKGRELGLLLEDHDMHHRHGWKKSGNYGKQTRVWDYVFGTCKDRLECAEHNIDWNNKLKVL